MQWADGGNLRGRRAAPSTNAAAEARLRAVIPGGAHTYARGADQYPEGLAPVITHGHGCHVEDVEGRRYIEYGSGLRAVILGHGHPVVGEAVTRSIHDGQIFVRPHALEIEAAERLVELIPCADMVKFGVSGSDATSAAVRLARAATGRDLIAYCSDHPFFATYDWFIATTAMPGGIPAGVKEQALGFRFNDVASLEAVLDAHEGRVAAVILEAQNIEPPQPGFLEAVRALCDRHGVVMILDEIITGFRWELRGAQHRFGITPDLCTFAKGMGNGFPIAALAGRRELMELGGYDHDRERVFLLSQTYGGLRLSLTAFLATVDVMEAEDVQARLRRTGSTLRDRINAIALELGILDHFSVVGDPAGLLYVTKDARGERSQEFRTLFLQETIRRGVLAPNLFVSAAMGPEEVDRTVHAVEQALVVYRKALQDGLEGLLHGRSVLPALRSRA